MIYGQSVLYSNDNAGNLTDNVADESITYSITNKEYHHNTGMTIRRRNRLIREANNEDRFYTSATVLHQQLSELTHKVSTYNQLLTHFIFYYSNDNFTTLKLYANQKHLKKERYYNFRDKARYINQIAMDLYSNDDITTDANVQIKNILVYGNGGRNKPGTRGYDTIPNKHIVKAFAKYMPVIISDENYTSKLINCHNALATHGYHDNNSPRKIRNAENDAIKKILKRNDEYKIFYNNLLPEHRNFETLRNHITVEDQIRMDGYKDNYRLSIRGMCHCHVCGATWNRELNACINIRKIFIYQIQHAEYVNPLRNIHDNIVEN